MSEVRELFGVFCVICLLRWIIVVIRRFPDNHSEWATESLYNCLAFPGWTPKVLAEAICPLHLHHQGQFVLEVSITIVSFLMLR